jgi:hypothetical protein
MLTYADVCRYDETASATADFFRMANRDVYVIDLDKSLHEILKALYKHTHPPPHTHTSYIYIYI